MSRRQSRQRPRTSARFAGNRGAHAAFSLVRLLDPLPDVPARIEPLGPAPATPARVPAAPGWSAFAQSMCRVREYAPGDRPRDWMVSDEALKTTAVAPSAELEKQKYGVTLRPR